ncbi:BZ3500_MvSof-1268-A1-R1_Chr2-2g05113 [Microbotryum saponariae]|uniref:Structural maintenance of chromosomes protein n=1 Tax=Microbotryum saponariae TaxID=289078 RepID=A0A2X0K6F8_9BASI|nr:BZ3500_MvSof-1268-A1-R1_Chr2-2g05113 [Microbotryum saponariae]SDA00940.1 BZ3501_MvSof-1269-A2-R1_Chr2-2g04787 [Microbotryum saponariae]
MRITELVLDGFKSYPVRTSISGWDPSFNAITGLNGSGKSNILDSICFVLGITNLTTVRASNLLDLIYKRGQAGVTRASVTIVFDNSDKSKAPVGFEAHPEISVTRQIALNGTSKYLICGHRSTQAAVQNLFQSVQLNINNPNFLIMQGKITKVLNMRPQEILSMIEEAAGTSMFEEKKDKAVKTMAKKEKRLDEIQDLLKEEIVPKLDRLREEKRVFLEFQKKASELERLSRLVVAWDWLEVVKRLKEGGVGVEKSEKRLEKAVESKARMDKEAERMEKDVLEIEKRREAELAKGGKVARLEQEQTELAKECSKLEAQVDIMAGNIKDEQARVAQLETNAKEVSGYAGLASSRKERDQSSKEAAQQFASLKANYDATTTSLKASEDLLQTLLTGISSSSDESTSSGFMGQLAKAKELASNLGTEAERAKARIEHLQKELKEKEPRAKKAASEGKGLISELEAAKKERAMLEAALGKMGWDEDKETQLRERRDVEGKAVRKLLEERDAIKSNLAQLDFSYTIPHRGFDQSQVKGLVANLVSLDESNFHAATALEVAAGGRLYNVVVQDENVGADLIKGGQMRKRVTFIPLSKIKASVASKETLRTVSKVSPQTKLALSMVGYDDELNAAMEYIFGSTLICADSDEAKLVTFHNEIRMRSVTLEGDVYSPDGTLSGGSRSQGAGILVKVQQLKKVEAELKARQQALDAAEKAFDQTTAAMDKYKQAKKQLDLKAHEVGLLEERVQESNATRIISEVESIKTVIETLKQTIVDSKAKQKEAQADCKRIEKEMDEFKNNRGSKLDQIKAEIKKKKGDVTKQTVEVKTLQREVQTAELELEQMEKDIAASGVELAEARTHLVKTEAALLELKKTVKQKQNELKVIEAKITEETKMLTAFQDELDALDRAIKAKRQEIVDTDMAVTELKLEIERAKKDQKNAADAVAKLESRFEWIQDECQTFGKEGSQYNFANVNMNGMKAKCQKLEEEQNAAKKKVNPKVLTMIDRCVLDVCSILQNSVEKKEKELIGMYRQVLKDKSKIEETVAKLDDYKKDALQKTWETVNVEFGNIFAELLPGNFSKLQPPEGMDITQGLEVKVRLGTVWKASLTELSGGQRSLIALSLIMALLHFKPAPMYILDEIDAALDLSHTENIGRLFRTRFKGSQFIVVSLKDGLFSNANVLFRARFRDGTSIVERTSQRSASGLYDKENAQPKNTSGAGSKGRGAALSASGAGLIAAA